MIRSAAAIDCRYGRFLSLVACVALIAACGGGGEAQVATPAAVDNTSPADGCDGSCAGPTSFLTVADVQTVIAQAVAEAQARGVRGTIAVSDRVGNILVVYRMAMPDGHIPQVKVTSTPPGAAIDGGLDRVALVPESLAAIAKAVTGAYLSSEGNAFTTRTASQIVQDHFNPGELRQPGGPLFGVQFSQLPCSDFSLRFGDGLVGPKRSPLGLSADPGGLPLFKGGTPVGGIGVITDGIYGLDKNVADLDQDVDELVALAGAFGFAAPIDRRGDRITADGKTFRFTDAVESDLASDPATAAAFASLGAADGEILAVPQYSDGSIRQGTAFGQSESGIRPDALDFPGLDAFVLVDGADAERFRPRDGIASPDSLTAGEVRELLSAALAIANRSRAQIRRPTGSPARVSISVVDLNGDILGIARTRDAPIFGLDVSLQKARTATFFSSMSAAASLQGVADAGYIRPNLTIESLDLANLANNVLRLEDVAEYVDAVRQFTGQPDALTGGIAFADRSGGNLSRPYYPDGIDSNPHGPLSKPKGEWSIFSTGLQLDLVYNAVIQHVVHVITQLPGVNNGLFGLGLPDVDEGRVFDSEIGCTGVGTLPDLFAESGSIHALRNGIQIFPGSVPIYRDRTLVGGIGVSGDGVDQDDMIAFLGVHDAGETLGTVNNAPADIRADTLSPQGTPLRYINCPQTPFLDSDEQNVCGGK